MIPYVTEAKAEGKSKVNSAVSEAEVLKLIADNCNVRFEVSSSGQVEYDYDTTRFDVSETVSDLTTTVTAKQKTGAEDGRLPDMIIIRIPEHSFDKIVVNSNKAGVTLPSLNVNFDLMSEGGSMSVPVPIGYNKTVNYKLIKGAGSIDFKQKVKDFKVSLEAVNSAVAVPSDWPVVHPGSAYKYTKGTGTGHFNIDVSKSSLTISNVRK
jgi:hypothetical protein